MNSKKGFGQRESSRDSRGFGAAENLIFKITCVKFLNRRFSMTSTTKTQQEKDPVCGMKVDPKQTSLKTQHNQKEYAFCSKQCLDKFKKNPDQFAK